MYIRLTIRKLNDRRRLAKAIVNKQIIITNCNAQQLYIDMEQLSIPRCTFKNLRTEDCTIIGIRKLEKRLDSLKRKLNKEV